MAKRRQARHRQPRSPQKAGGITSLVTVALLVVAAVALLHGDNSAAVMALVSTGLIPRH